MKVLITAIWLILSFTQSSAASERGLFVWSLEDQPVLCSRTEIDKLVEFSHTHGINKLFVQIYRSNMSWFPSNVGDSEPYNECFKKVSEDPFELLIKKAHQKNIEVHAWVNMLSLGNNKNAKILQKYGPQILTRNVYPKRALDEYKIDKQFFLEPSDRNVRHESLLLIREILQRYKNLDGIEFDYIRYPDEHPFYGYSKDNMDRFKKATGKTAIKEEDPSWKQWKRDQVTDYLKALVKEARSIRPDIHISTTGCLSYSRAYDEALQEWPSWINHHIIEFVTVMNYPPDQETFEKNLIGLKPYVKDFKRMYIAVGAYKEEEKLNDFLGQMKICDESGAKGCVLFHYNVLEKKKNFSRAL